MTARILSNLIRAGALGAVLIAGSCAVQNDGQTIKEDGAVNHPIAIEPSYREIKLGFSGSEEGVSADDAVKFDNFLADYRAHGNGSLGINVPDGVLSRAAISFFAERAAQSGISSDKIPVSTHVVANGDYRVNLSYIPYTAHAEDCGYCSENVAFNLETQAPKN